MDGFNEGMEIWENMDAAFNTTCDNDLLNSVIWAVPNTTREQLQICGMVWTITL